MKTLSKKPFLIQQKNHAGLLAKTILTLGILVIVLPLYLTVITPFKTSSEILGNFFALPKTFYLGNFKKIFSKPNYFYAIRNSIVITGCSVAIMSIILPMLAYPLARGMQEQKVFKFIYFLIVSGIFVPFQVRMLPLMKLVNTLGLMNISGIIILYIATSTCEGTYLYVAFMASMPKDMEEAAYIDGAGTHVLFWKIIYPLLKPITATILIKNSLWIWNDFFLPLLVLNRSYKLHTIVLFQHSFKTAYTTDYTLAFTTFFMSILPIILVYISAQKYIIPGLTSGAVKG